MKLIYFSKNKSTVIVSCLVSALTQLSPCHFFIYIYWHIRIPWYTATTFPFFFWPDCRAKLVHGYPMLIHSFALFNCCFTCTAFKLNFFWGFCQIILHILESLLCLPLNVTCRNTPLELAFPFLLKLVYKTDSFVLLA